MNYRFFLAAAAQSLMLFLCAPVLAQEKIRVAGNFATEHSSSIAMEQVFKKELARVSNNQMGVDIFPAMQLGGAKENVDAVRSGALFMTWVGAAFLTRIVPELEAVSLPFLFPSRDAAFRVTDGPVGQLLDQKLGDKGFISLGWMELGSRHVTNSKRAIRGLADLKGLKIRMQPNETHLASFRALGANPVAMDVKELYSALEQGVVDGQENPYAIILTNRYGEVQKYVSNTGHFFDFIAVVANRKQFQAMKPEMQKAIRGAMTLAIEHQRKLAVELDTKALEELKKKMQYDALTPQAVEELRKASASVVDTVKKRAGAELVDRVIAEVAKSR
ncbi:MAG: TRAP transporter substrate-binding protein [Betaproteobacteria bacterium]|nr:TRAP transporter substrate-binding protein [Betaproteobacteria bacterium]